MQDLSEKTVVSDVYHGSIDQSEHARTIASCEHAWNKERLIGSFDSLLARQLLIAKDEGRENVTVIDIGSGDAMLFQNFVSNPTLCPETEKILKSNPKLKLKLVGITDSPTTQEMFVKKQFFSPTDLAEQISCWNEYYSLTATQTLDTILNKEGIENVDLALSTWCFTYMGPKNFEITLNSVIAHLRPNGGFMVAAAYAEQEIPGFIRKDPSLPHDLDVRNIVDDESAANLLKVALQDSHMRFYTRGADLDKEERGLELAEKRLIEMGVVTDPDIKEAIEQYHYDLESGNRTRGGALSIRATDIITRNMEKIARRQMLKLKTQKQTILRQLKEKMNDVVDVEYSDSTFTVRKI